jgi:single-stranded DNA-binding protein
MNGLHVAATGRVTSEAPDERCTMLGKRFANITVVVDQAHTVATEDRPTAPATWLRVTVWEPTDALLAQLGKGASVYCEGRLTHRDWTAADGTPRCGLNLSAWRVEVHAQLGKAAPRQAAG